MKFVVKKYPLSVRQIILSFFLVDEQINAVPACLSCDAQEGQHQNTTTKHSRYLVQNILL